MPRGLYREVKAECRQREGRHGALPLLRSAGGVFWGSQARARLVSSNQKRGVWRSPMKGYLRDA